MELFTAFTKKQDGNMVLIENQKQFLKKNNLENKVPILMKQCHTNKVCIVDANYKPSECDALVTHHSEVALFVLVADCQPILIYDEVREVIAVVHAGREGVYKNIVKEVIDIFVAKFESNPKDIKVIIGPSIQKCCYEVAATSDEHIDYVRTNFGENFVHRKNIDLQGITISQLLKQDILEENITRNNICTSDSSDYFSYRNDDNNERFAGVIAFK